MHSPFSGSSGRFGPFGGAFVPDTLVAALRRLERAWKGIDAPFRREFARELAEFAGRPTPLHRAERWTRRVGGPEILLKREDLNHTGSHKLNNVIGQLLLARRLGKRRIIAETGAGQHGVATATGCARYGLSCTVYMGAEDCERQALNVYRMRLLGATVAPVESGSRTLKDAINEAIRDWVSNVDTTHYVIGSVVGPHPYPSMVRDFQSVIGREVKRQMAPHRPDAVVACVGGGSNAIGAFHAFIPDRRVRLVGAEAGGSGVSSGRHAATLVAGRPGVLHGSYSYLLQDRDGQVVATHSVSAGLDYPGVGPEHAWLKESGRADYVAVTDREALEAFHRLAAEEGILPALESAHAVAAAEKLARRMRKGRRLVVIISGRGDKDVEIVRES